ncbi:unnamed protein product [Bursaphelenchus okinawaensis]|uniref:Uncharacterized protein n=1 Tax=Bursaphelenchus okinawaensis TaxID=465554 RepID=A0A811K124_9BILA|nr:unnamed protein product [Bursaphelenchus okinawaensis]CAG9088563.1 unnamed protein product [Bursaphelenchus okinawaensis]
MIKTIEVEVPDRSRKDERKCQTTKETPSLSSLHSGPKPTQINQLPLADQALVHIRAPQIAPASHSGGQDCPHSALPSVRSPSLLSILIIPLFPQTFTDLLPLSSADGRYFAFSHTFEYGTHSQP